MTKIIELSHDLQSGRYYGDSLSRMDSVTLYGCRYAVGINYGDGQGAPLTRIGLWDFPHHNTLDDMPEWMGDCTQPDSELPPIHTTVRDYRRMCDDFPSDELPPDAPITVFADNSWCAGHFDGSQTAESLI